MKITLISQFYNGYKRGGAEKSIQFELEKVNGDHISFEPSSQTANNYPIKHNKYFPYAMLYLKKKEIHDFLSTKKIEYAWIQGHMAPIVAEYLIRHNIPYTYWIRDEQNLNQFLNYEIGWKHVAKFVKDNVLQRYFISKYKQMNSTTIRKANKVVCNSKYMQNQLKILFRKDSIMTYPPIDYKNFLVKDSKKEFILFVGGNNEMKGFSFVQKIAERMPDHTFCIVGPYKTHKVNNIIYHKYVNDMSQLYNKAKLLLVPSKWNEAFGRVVLEAKYFGVDVITSDKGGLPETKPNTVLPLNVEDWIKKINELV